MEQYLGSSSFLDRGACGEKSVYRINLDQKYDRAKSISSMNIRQG